MSRIPPVGPSDTPAASVPLLDAVQAKLGFTPNMMKTMAHAPSVLRGYLGLAEALAGGTLSAAEHEGIALAVGETNRCDYCVAAHSALGKGAGLSDADVAGARRGHAAEPRRAALLQFAQAVARSQGRVDDAALARARGAGIGDAQLLEAVAVVVLNVLTNTVNLVAQTELDFPPAPPLALAA